jgi:hypothetical protein
MPVIQSSVVIGKNEDGSDITQDDVLVWWRDVGQARFPRIAVMTRQFLAIVAASAAAECHTSQTCGNLCLKVR